MSSLRRDLIERRLWPLAVVLIAAIVAVPFLLAGHGHTDHAALADSAPAPAASPAAGSSTTSSSASPTRTATGRQRAGDSKTRDPFAAAAASTSTTATTGARSATSNSGSAGSAGASQTASSSTPGSSTGAAPSPAAPILTTPTTSTPTTSTPTTSTPTTSTPTTSTPILTTPTTSTPTTGTTSTTPTTVSTSRHPAGAGEKWSLYSVDVRIKAPDGTASAITNLPRLIPLPAATWPKLMYMGTTDGGRDAVFALGDGVSARGRARCRPAHDNCSLIVLAPGQAEAISWTIGVDQRRTLQLTVTRITTKVTRVRHRATAAIARHSQVGLCELQLGDPIQFQYDTSNGVLASASRSACTKSMKKTAAAFPGTASEAGQ